MPHSFQPPLHSGRVVNYYSPLLRCHRSLSLSPVGSATSSHKVSPTSRGRSPHRGTAPPLSSRPSATNRPLASLALRRRNVSHLFVFLFFSTCHSQLLPMRCTGKKEISDIWGKRGASYGETGVCRRIQKLCSCGGKWCPLFSTGGVWGRRVEYCTLFQNGLGRGGGAMQLESIRRNRSRFLSDSHMCKCEDCMGPNL